MPGSGHENSSSTITVSGDGAGKVSGPETGPRILFFSGGTALRKLSRRLVQHTHRSIHLITPFDSGGSSAALRKAFDMPAVGDLRNRLVALADPSISGRPEIYRLLVHRLEASATSTKLRGELEDLCSGGHWLMSGIAGAEKDTLCRLFGQFEARMPEHFDLRGASLGNLVLAGGYLGSGRQLETALDLFAELIGAQGTVAPIVHENLHIAAELENGTRLIGQHRITGKETPAITSPIQRVWLTSGAGSLDPETPSIRESTAKWIEHADLICFPMGSFYTSVMANLLPSGVGKAVARAKCPKVYVPNLGHDPEALGLTVLESTRRLLESLAADAGPQEPKRRLLNHVLLDSTHGHYPGAMSARRLRQLGIEVIDAPLVTPHSAPLLDEDLLIGQILSLV